MPRVSIPVTDIDRDGVVAPSQVTADATNDHFFTLNDGKVFLEIVSTDGSPQTVEVVTSPTFFSDGLTLTNLSIAVAAGGTVYAGPFRVTTFKQNATNDVYVNPSVSTTLKFRAYRLPAP